MRIKYFSIFFILITSNSLKAQQKWNLRTVVDYALTNNITIKQSVIQSRIAELQYKQSKLGQYPDLNFNGNTSFNSGRNQDPTSFNLITQSYLSAGIQLQSNVDIFNWYSKRNTIAAN